MRYKHRAIDPKVRVGSGGASVNALLVVAEHLSAKAGYEVKYAINDRQFYGTVLVSRIPRRRTSM